MYRLLILVLSFQMGLYGSQNWYSNWLFAGGAEIVARQNAEAERVRLARDEYVYVETLNRAYKLTIEVNEIDIQINTLIKEKAELYQNKLTSERVEISLKKLAKDLKKKTDELVKLVGR